MRGSMAEMNGFTEDQFRNYDVHLESIPRMNVDDERVDEYIAAGKPVVIAGTNLVASALHWDLEYLENHMGDGDYTVFVSPDHKFKYYDDKKSIPGFTPPTRRVDMKLPEFAMRMRNWTRGDERLYLQQALNSTVGSAIVNDFINFKWDWIRTKQKKHSWGNLTSNLLLISMEGNVTPCHYDEQENFFAQVRGYKRCILFPPGQFECFYPYPVFHPHDRQSQVDFEKPDLQRFPKFHNVRGQEAILCPGDVLYIPIYWWHQIESLMKASYTLSINFWYKAGPTGSVTYPLKDHQKVAIMRNVEKMLVEALQNKEEVGPLLRALVLGRYTE